MGFYTSVEYHTAKGRADVVIKTDKYIYVMEFKRDRSAQAAMQQIKDKDYAKPVKLDGRKIVLVGANFALDMSALDGVLVEEGRAQPISLALDTACERRLFGAGTIPS